MTVEEWDALHRDLEHDIAAIIDRHRILRRLPDLDRRNAAYCASWDLLGAVRGESIEAL